MRYDKETQEKLQRFSQFVVQYLPAIRGDYVPSLSRESRKSTNY